MIHALRLVFTAEFRWVHPGEFDPPATDEQLAAGLDAPTATVPAARASYS